MKKKKYRIRWGRMAMLLAALTAVGIAIYYAIVGIVAFIVWIIGMIEGLFEDETPRKPKVTVVVTKQQQAETDAMTARVDSFMALPTRLDKNKIAVAVYDLTTRKPVYSYHADRLMVPASCMKIPTAIAALKTLGMEHKYQTSLHMSGTLKNDTLFGTLLLNAEADPVMQTLMPLCEKLRQKGVRHVRGDVRVNLALKDRLLGHPSSKSWDIPYNRTPLLLKGTRFVTAHLLATLRSAGVTYRKDTTVSHQGEFQLVATATNTLQDAIIPMMRNSSNIFAEAVFYHLDWKQKLAAGQQKWNIEHTVEKYWRKEWQSDSTLLNGRFVFNDGSGLSPHNRLNAASLIDMLCRAYDDKPLRDYLINRALATPGNERRGSLLSRMSQAEYRDRIYCKTGTMTTIGASSLAGYICGSDAHWYAFAIINADSPVAESRLFQDKLCRMMMKKKRGN